MAPINFAEKSGDRVLYETKKYIPGNVIRGALAGEYIRNNNLKQAHLDEKFYNLFLSGKVRFLPAYPCGSPQLLKDGYMPVVLPSSLMKSKKKLESDNYIDMLASNSLEVGYKKYSGFGMLKNNSIATEIVHIECNTKIEFHMSRADVKERIQGRSINKKIYNYEYIVPYQCFAGQIIIDDDIDIQELESMLTGELYLGRAKNAQYGKCHCNTISLLTNNVPTDGEKLFLHFKTPYIADAEWCNISQPIDEIIGCLRDNGIDIPNNNQRQIYAASEDINGYVGVWNMKRERVTAIAAGSLVELCDKLSGDDITKLQNLLLRGLGRRTEEGFGQLMLWQPLQNISVSDFEEAADVEAKVILSAEVMEKAENIIENRLLVEVHKQAEADAKAVKGDIVKHTLKKVEFVIESCSAKASSAGNYTVNKEEIKNAVNQLKIVKANLSGLYLNGSSAYDLLMENVDNAIDYDKILYSMKLKNSAELLQEIGLKIDDKFKNKIYREYWLWFMRTAAKKGGSCND